MDNLIEQIKQINDPKKFYSIIDNFYRKNNILHIRIIRTKCNFIIFYNKELYIDKHFDGVFPYIYNNDKYIKEWLKKNSKRYKYFQTLYFFDQITNE